MGRGPSLTTERIALLESYFADAMTPTQIVQLDPSFKLGTVKQFAKQWREHGKLQSGTGNPASLTPAQVACIQEYHKEHPTESATLVWKWFKTQNPTVKVSRSTVYRVMKEKLTPFRTVKNIGARMIFLQPDAFEDQSQDWISNASEVESPGF